MLHLLELVATVADSLPDGGANVRQPEVRDLGTCFVQQDVVALDVAVSDTVLVKVFKPL